MNDYEFSFNLCFIDLFSFSFIDSVNVNCRSLTKLIGSSNIGGTPDQCNCSDYAYQTLLEQRYII